MDDKQYRHNYKDFMIKKSRFLSIVLSEWERFIDTKARHLEKAMQAEDRYLSRHALNFEQFCHIVTAELKLSIKHAFGPMAYATYKRGRSCSYVTEPSSSTREELQRIFTDAVGLQESTELQEQKLISFETARDLILRSNCEVLPFHRYI